MQGIRFDITRWSAVMVCRGCGTRRIAGDRAGAVRLAVDHAATCPCPGTARALSASLRGRTLRASA